MSCAAEKLYQLEFVVKTVMRCSSQTEDDGCGTAVTVEFCGLPEQTVCEMPAVPKCEVDGTTVTSVDRGQTFTFALPATDCYVGNCGPKPICVTVRLCRLQAANTLPRRTVLATGRVNVVPCSCRPSDYRDEDDEQTVPVVDCPDGGGRTVALLTVKTRAWDAGPVMSAAIKLDSGCCPTNAPATPDCSDGCPPQPACVDECDLPKPRPISCCPREPPTVCRVDECGRPMPPRPCPRRCDKCNCCATGRRRPSSSVAQEPHRQFTTVCCEIDGRKIDLRVRKKNFETCVVQRRIAKEAEEFASRVMAVVQDMHELITDSVCTKITE